MYYDESRGRYFPGSLKGRSLVGGVGVGVCDVDMPWMDEGVASGSTRARRSIDGGGKRRRRMVLGRRPDTARSMTEDRMSRMTDAGTERFCSCPGETITSFRAFPTGGHYATTDHGKVILQRAGSEDQGGGRAFQMSVCSQRLLGLHVNVPGMSYTAVANGPDPHLHLFRRDPSALDHFTVGQAAIDLPKNADIYAMSSHVTALTLAASRSLVVVDAETSRTARRALRSDPLAVHHVDAHVVLAGLRSGGVLLDDTRARPGHVVAAVPRGKAVIGVRRLADAAVPFGILASAMDHELVLFDARFAAAPLRRFHHVNEYNSDLALATSPDDYVVFAAGGDRRLRAYSTVTGEPIVARARNVGAAAQFASQESPLARVWANRVEHVDVDHDEIHVVEGQSVATFAVEEVDLIGYDTELD
ncbi:hypothetical protein Q5752_004563 [Cryptotrichosporon argae]